MRIADSWLRWESPVQSEESMRRQELQTYVNARTALIRKKLARTYTDPELMAALDEIDAAVRPPKRERRRRNGEA